MAAPEMGMAYDALTSSLGGSLDGYMHGLRAQFTPHVVMQQQLAEQEAHARAEHEEMRRRETHAKSAYDNSTAANRAAHGARMSKRQTASSRQQSAPKTPTSRKPAPQQPPASVPKPGPPASVPAPQG